MGRNGVKHPVGSDETGAASAAQITVRIVSESGQGVTLVR